jgi:hypothetical protein
LFSLKLQILFNPEQVIHQNFVLDDSAVFVFPDSVGGYESMVQGLAGLRHLLEKRRRLSCL